MLQAIYKCDNSIHYYYIRYAPSQLGQGNNTVLWDERLLKLKTNLCFKSDLMKIGNYILGTLAAIALFSCDAVNHLYYSVQNKTVKNIHLHIPYYPLEPLRGEFSAITDTIIEIKPNESIWLGTSLMDIDFPWATKNIYKENPGICGLELIKNDTVIKLDCSNSSWKYNKRWSTLKIRNTKAQQ